jgi:hypothetical protein
LADQEIVENLLRISREVNPEELLLRILTKAKWLTDLHEAFMLRSDEDGLSVFFDCNAAKAVEVSGLSSHGVAGLVTSGVTALSLSVDTDEQPNHATIKGIPHKEADASRAEWFASRLAALASIVDRTRVKR